ncbi:MULTISPECIES: glycosyltransferase [unclassified Leptolyngbya]|uniref:glycosyltransferase n=1 Tax=unclassified Leptolyngbya TaxID=2650499 RepID=UPI0016868DB0|nr:MULTISPECIES: glycosyltransferase [unclassified Leptolyngbya]MBD1909854.1 UDP-N-acetylglucosamine--LPS N-acetylglucosamine transferase [Leptolyngbya sp. FACHB-8]MBD2156950.1 UDP-N-acetylglucosamine--LPS N-acetylglucosamine transferase [Leptolyngbya sp. FACHB-16]
MQAGWLIYAMGGGWGHLNRAIAIARPLAQHHSVHILTNSPYAPFMQSYLSVLPNLQFHTLAPDIPLSEACYQIWRWLKTLPYTGLLVDTFPRGLVGELADLLPKLSDRSRILIHRDLNPRYVASHHLTDFVRCHYERLWIPGEGTAVPFATLPQVRQSAPWLVRQPGELGDRSTACTLLNVEPHDPSPLVLVLLAGQPEEQAFFVALSEAIAHTFPQVTLRLLAPEPPKGTLPYPWIAHYPAMDVLWMADVVIGSGGYNTVHECIALKVPLIAVPWKRLYDRQAMRLKRLQNNNQDMHIAYSLPEVMSVLEWVLATAPASQRQMPPDFVNGAIAPEVLQDLSSYIT